MRVNLKVPFDRRHEVKALGAFWDPRARTWYVPPHLSLRPFARFLYAPVDTLEAKRTKFKALGESRNTQSTGQTYRRFTNAIRKQTEHL